MLLSLSSDSKKKKLRLSRRDLFYTSNTILIIIARILTQLQLTQSRTTLIHNKIEKTIKKTIANLDQVISEKSTILPSPLEIEVREEITNQEGNNNKIYII